MNKHSSTGLILAIAFLATGCSGGDQWKVEQCFPDVALRDSVMVQLVTYIYRAPKGVALKDRFQPEHRSWYLNQMKEFEWLYCSREDDGAYLFYMLRPTRNVGGKKRGVAGRFSLKSGSQVTDYFELLNTPEITPESVREKGKILIAELVKNGNFAAYAEDPEWVEFPNKDCYYDPTIYEWVYRKPGEI